MQKILDQVAALFDLESADLTSSSRTRHVALARQAAAWVLRRAYPSLSLQDIGQILGGRDHTTIIWSLQQVERRMSTEPRLAAELRALVGDVPLEPPRRRRFDRAMRWWATQGRESWQVLAA